MRLALEVPFEGRIVCDQMLFDPNNPKPRSTRILNRAAVLASLFLPAFSFSEEPRGAMIYREMCTECHGANGEGVEGKSDDPLHGDRSRESLAKRIDRTMPEDEEDLCVGEDAKAVADYIYDAFYSAEARARLAPPEVALSRLTVNQFRTSVADVLGGLRGETGQLPKDGARGLRASYFGSKDFRDESRDKDGDEMKKRGKFERVDPQVRFDFRDGSPDAQIPGAEQFSVRWQGSIIAEETGTYEFAVKTLNGTRLWVNDTEKPLVDAWVSSGNEPREESGSLFLLGGRAYPIRIDFFKYKEKAAQIELLWKPPFGVHQTVPVRNLSPQEMPEACVVGTAFPPDDASFGYERGVAVSKAWDEATTGGAIEAANYVSERLRQLARVNEDAPDRAEKLKEFCARFAEAAFRRPLDDAARALYIERPFQNAPDPGLAVRRCVLLALKSPRFLYPELPDDDGPDNFDVASRLALALWDSVPDRPLLDAARKGQLGSREQVADQARRMLGDARSRAKMHGFFEHWLELERAKDVEKDREKFPDFDATTMADLRVSLNLFVDGIVWGERSDFRQLLLAETLPLNAPLAKLYGAMPDGRGEGFEEVTFDPKQRVGVLTHPYLLAALAHDKFTSPIHRGIFLTQSIMGRTIKPPPMAIVFEDSKLDPSLTMREKITELTRDTSCMGCHGMINPLGFTLEHYDAIGRWRTEDNAKPVDSASDYETGDGETIHLSDARDIAEFAVGNAFTQSGFVKQLFQHTVKQPAGAYGVDTLEKLRETFVASEFNMKNLLAEIAVTAAWRGMERDGQETASAKTNPPHPTP
jgi:hypothetical protein